MVGGGFGQYIVEEKKKDSINGNVSVVVGREWTCIQCNQCCWLVVLVVGTAGGFPGGETWLSSLEITCSHQLLRRNIKIHLDITQVFYHALSDPILPYHTLHTLKHGYPFLDTLLTFKCKRWKRQGYILHEVEEIWSSFIVSRESLEETCTDVFCCYCAVTIFIFKDSNPNIRILDIIIIPSFPKAQ